MSLSPEQLERYSRQLLLDGFGAAGQEKLLRSSVLVVGTGGLGSAILNYLAAAGVGRIGIMDADRVEQSNLQRQVLHTTGDLGRLKVESARDRLRALNPDVVLETFAERLRPSNAMTILASYDAVVDACDNFATRFLINDACFLLGRPWFHGSALAWQGQAASFFTGEPESPCYRCIFSAPPAPGEVPTSAQVGILGAVAAFIGTVEAVECIKHLLGAGKGLAGRLLIYDALTMSVRTIAVRRNPACLLCGRSPAIHSIAKENYAADT